LAPGISLLQCYEYNTSEFKLPEIVKFPIWTVESISVSLQVHLSIRQIYEV